MRRWRVSKPKTRRCSPHRVVLKFFGGLTSEEVAESLNISERMADRQWAYASSWLLRHYNITAQH